MYAEDQIYGQPFQPELKEVWCVLHIEYKKKIQRYFVFHK